MTYTQLLKGCCIITDQHIELASIPPQEVLAREQSGGTVREGVGAVEGEGVGAVEGEGEGAVEGEEGVAVTNHLEGETSSRISLRTFVKHSRGARYRTV